MVMIQMGPICLTLLSLVRPCWKTTHLARDHSSLKNSLTTTPTQSLAAPSFEFFCDHALVDRDFERLGSQVRAGWGISKIKSLGISTSSKDIQERTLKGEGKERSTLMSTSVSLPVSDLDWLTHPAQDLPL